MQSSTDKKGGKLLTMMTRRALMCRFARQQPLLWGRPLRISVSSVITYINIYVYTYIHIYTHFLWSTVSSFLPRCTLLYKSKISLEHLILTEQLTIKVFSGNPNVLSSYSVKSAPPTAYLDRWLKEDTKFSYPHAIKFIFSHHIILRSYEYYSPKIT